MNFVFMVHIGQKIKQVLGESRIPVKEFAGKISKSRTVVYNIFERKTIDTGLLFRIGKVLNHDFFGYYHEGKQWMAKEDVLHYLTKNEAFTVINEELQKCKKELAELKEKYELQRKINTLLEEKQRKERSGKKNG